MNAVHAGRLKAVLSLRAPKKTPVRMSRPAFFLEVMRPLTPRRRFEGSIPSSEPAGACAITASKVFRLFPCIQNLVTLSWKSSILDFSPSSAPRRSDTR